jgi:hypothetical protein
LEEPAINGRVEATFEEGQGSHGTVKPVLLLLLLLLLLMMMMMTGCEIV